MSIRTHSMRRIRPYCNIIAKNTHKSMGTTDKTDKKGFQQMPYKTTMTFSHSLASAKEARVQLFSSIKWHETWWVGARHSHILQVHRHPSGIQYPEYKSRNPKIKSRQSKTSPLKIKSRHPKYKSRHPKMCFRSEYSAQSTAIRRCDIVSDYSWNNHDIFSQLGLTHAHLGSDCQGGTCSTVQLCKMMPMRHWSKKNQRHIRNSEKA